MLNPDLLLMGGAVIAFAGWLIVSRRARTICRASVTHMKGGCEICPKTFKVTVSK